MTPPYLNWWRAAVFAGVLSAGAYTYRKLDEEGVSPVLSALGILVVAASGWVGSVAWARLMPGIGAHGAVSVTGAVLAIMASAALSSTVAGHDPLKLIDATSPALLILLALVRTGCYLEGCCYGLPYSGPLAICSRLAPGVHRFPIQPLLVCWYAFWFAAIFRLKASSRTDALKPGQVTILVLAAFFTGRVMGAYTRDALPYVTKGLPFMLITGASGLAACAISFAVLERIWTSAARKLP